MRALSILCLLGLSVGLPGCLTEASPCPGTECSDPAAFGGKADGDSWPGEGAEVIFTAPFCDVCTSEEKDILLARSEIIARVVTLIGRADRTLQVAQFTFSRREIEDALVAAHERGVEVQVAMDAGQDRDGSLSRRLQDRGVDVRFVSGRVNGDRSGLMHAKFMIVDGDTLVTGSNNWSSTGVSINSENTMFIQGGSDHPVIGGFSCHFNAIWGQDPESAGACSTEDVAFSPSAAGKNMIRDALREATESIDVLMHHLTFTDLVKELANAQERGISVRVIVNADDRDQHSGGPWERLFAAGGEIRFKRGNAEAYQFMHHKLAIIDGNRVINGSGNWSGSGFFNNFENYVTYRDAHVTAAFVSEFEGLWTWSLTEGALEGGWTAAEQDQRLQRPYFGNLHSHMEASHDGHALDDGEHEIEGPDGESIDRDAGTDVPEAARFAFAYARDRAGLDFMALSPHCTDATDNDAQNMTEEGFEELLDAARQSSSEAFLALASMEWSTNSTGNHVGILGSSEIAKTERGRFDDLYGSFLGGRAAAGELPVVMMNHPRTFRSHDVLRGNWDQVFGHNLMEIENRSDRNAKFNDYGLDDFSPLRDVRGSWLAGDSMPDEQTVADTLDTMWRAASPYTRLMEVTLNRGKEFRSETAQNPSIVIDEEGIESRRTKVHTDFDYYLSQGFLIAPVASHDNHYANWGMGHTSRTAVFAPRLNETRFLQALRHRAVYASEDENLDLRFFIEGRHAMGSVTQTIGANVSAQVFVSNPDSTGPFEVRIYGGRTKGVLPTILAQTADAEGWTELELPIDHGEQYFYVEVFDTGANRMAWSAPIWVNGL